MTNVLTINELQGDVNGLVRHRVIIDYTKIPTQCQLHGYWIYAKHDRGIFLYMVQFVYFLAFGRIFLYLANFFTFFFTQNLN